MTGKAAHDAANRAWSAGDLAEAFRLFLAAAEKGFVKAYGLLAHFYDFGEGTPANRDAAVHWYRLAARHGESMVAANNLGCIYRDEGRIGQALWWFHRAVRLGDGDAHLNIAKVHINRGDWDRAVPHLRATADGDVTEGSREEAEALLRAKR